MLLAVEADGGQWLTDVGFGADGLLLPIPLQPGVAGWQFAWRYRIMSEGPEYVLQSERAGIWGDLYSFTLEPQYPVDYQVANWYTSTHPKSVFRSMLRVQLPGPETRLMLVNRTLTETTAKGSQDTVIEGDAGLLKVLEERFGLKFQEGTQIPFAETSAAK